VPRARIGEVSLHYESTGVGAPVLLVMGLGMNATGWWRTVPVLAAAGLRVLSFDNRGVGRSARPRGPYTTAMLADDAVAVLDAAAVERAHVYGISLGGMIAQEIALRHPERVARLVLGATTSGGDGATAADRQTLEFFQRRGQMTALEAVWASVPYNRIARDISQRLRYPIEPEFYAAQLAAALAHDTHERLAQIHAPTLIVHGLEDLMVPPANGRLLASRIPAARLLELPGAAHLYPTDEPSADHDVAAFLGTSPD
jgi:3-oxoadipate enol-lactonase